MKDILDMPSPITTHYKRLVEDLIAMCKFAEHNNKELDPLVILYTIENNVKELKTKLEALIHV